MREKVIPLEMSIGVPPLTITHGNGLSWVNVTIATKRYGKKNYENVFLCAKTKCAVLLLITFGVLLWVAYLKDDRSGYMQWRHSLSQIRH